MTALSSILGSAVVSRATAEDLGSVQGVVVDSTVSAVVAWQVGKGRRATVVEHSHLTGIGAAAVVVDDEANARPAETTLEQATVKGRRPLLGHRTLSDAGDSLGEVLDAEIDIQSGKILSVRTPAGEFRAATLRGLGEFALVIETAADQEGSA